MRVLHYFLGFPPYRTGGLTKFAYDLMQTQKENGDEVFALWPGKMKFLKNKKTKIKKRKKIGKIENFEIINPLPVPLDEGISDIKAYTQKCDPNVYREFIEKLEPDVIHIHTLMGLHKEFVDVAIEEGVKVIFTAHDYFGICPKVILYKNNMTCDNDFGCEKCIECNYSALSLKKIKIMQSPVYRKIKNFEIIKILRKKHRQNFLKDSFKNTENIKNNKSEVGVKAEEYRTLRKYYMDILEKIDIIHFNSSNTKKIYLKYMKPKKDVLLNITHKDISDNRENKYLESPKMRFTFLASTKPYKGFYFLKSVLDEIYKMGKYDFELNVYGSILEKADYIKVYENGFKQSDLPEIFSKTDILVAPSLWYETFGFTVLEALCYDVPVLISENMGSKDIVGKCGIVVKTNDKNELKQKIENLDKNKILQMKKNIKETFEIPEWKDFCQKIKNIYEEI